MSIGFSPLGLIVFALPMVVNIAYCLLPPKDEVDDKKDGSIAERIEQVSRIIFMLLICFLVPERESAFTSPLFYASLVFLVLYHVVWLRYFLCGRKCTLLTESFLFIPIPLAVFPVLYYFLASLWLGNYPAAAVMAVFGISHYLVSKRQ